MARKRSRPAGQQAARRYHDRVARRYDDMYAGNAFWRLHDEITWRHIRRYLPREPGARVLDAGGGTGKWGIRLAKSGFEVLVMDLSPLMLQKARDKASREGLESRVSVVCGDISRLDFLPAGRFDMALAEGDPLSICDNPRRAVRSLFELLKPGGVFIASVDNQWAALWYHFERQGIDEELERVLRTGVTTWQTGKPQEQYRLQTFSPASLRSLVSDAGFEVLSLIGKTILPLRARPELLEDEAAYRKILEIELRLNDVPELLGWASHLEIAGRKPTA